MMWFAAYLVILGNVGLSLVLYNLGKTVGSNQITNHIYEKRSRWWRCKECNAASDMDNTDPAMEMSHHPTCPIGRLGL